MEIVSQNEEEALRFAADCNRAECIGMRLIARAEQTQTGLSYKLSRRGFSTACVNAVILKFIETDLVNDARYAERWLKSRVLGINGKAPCPRLLYAALVNRGINRDVIKSVFNSVLDEDTEFILLQRFLDKNTKKKMPENYSLKGFLRYEGFSTPVINRYFEEIL